MIGGGSIPPPSNMKISNKQRKANQKRALAGNKLIVNALMKKRTLSRNQEKQLDDSQKQIIWLEKELGITNETRQP